MDSLTSSQDVADQLSAEVTAGARDGFDHALERAALVLADTVAASWAGWLTTEASKLATQLDETEGHQAQATIFGASSLTTVGTAAFINAVTGCAVELDEGHRFARGHPGLHIIPGAVAMAEALDSSLDDLLASVVVGYEVAARVGLMMQNRRRAIHVHGTWPALGVVGALARLTGADPETTSNGLRIVATALPMPYRKATTAGDSVRNLYAGIGVRSALLALAAARSGFQGTHRVIEDHLQPLLATDGEISEPASGAYLILSNYFKVHGVCGNLGGLLDIVLNLAEHERLTERMAEIERIVVSTFAEAVGLSEPRPRTALAARFSIPFAIAYTVRYGRSPQVALTAEELADGQVAALAERVEIIEDLAASRAYPSEHRWSVAVHLAGGQSLIRFGVKPVGQFDHPASPDALRAKFGSLTEIDEADRIWDRITGRKYRYVRELTSELRAAAAGRRPDH